MKMCKKGIAWILALMLVLSMAPSVFAAEGENGTSAARPYEVKNPSAIPIGENNAVYRNKTLSDLEQDKNGDITGELTLETYVKGEVKTKGKPSDIVLVLDVSGSMNGDVVSYDAVYGSDIKKDKTYYISTADLWGDKVYRKVSYRNGTWHQEFSLNTVVPKNGPNDSDRTHTQFYVKDSQKKMTALKNAVNGFIDETDTANNGIKNDEDKNKISIVKFAGEKVDKTGNDFYEEDWNTYNYTQIVRDFTADSKPLKADISKLEAGGATSADYGMELAASQLGKVSRDSNKVVVFFTDGEPTYGSEFDSQVANAAIQKAKNLKDKNTKIYSIGIFNNADPSDTKNPTNAYMNGVSSNYPNATAYSDLGDPVANASYYKVAKNATDLTTIFEEISQEVNPTIELNENTVVQDVMSGYFDVKGSKDNIKVYTSNCNGQDTNGAYTFDDTNMSVLGSADVEVKGDVVSVKGFNFSGNAVAKIDKEFKGKKLIIKIPVKIDKAAIDEMGGTWVPSNGLNSAVFPADSEMKFEFNSPEVYLPVIESTAILQAESGTWTYDGENHSKTAGVVDGSGNAVEGYTISYSINGGQTWSQDVPTVKDVTKQNVLVKAERKGYTSLTGEFTLTVNKRPVMITAKSASKVFGDPDPKFENAILALEGDDINANKKAELIKADLKDVDLNVVRDTRSDKDSEAVGTHETVLSIKASAKELGEKYTNYVFTINPANFVITKSEALSIDAASVNEIYNGKHHAITDIKAYLGDKITEDATIEFWDGLKWVDKSPSLKNVGKTEVKVRATLEGYEDAECTATIEITKRPVTLTSESATKEYDGEALTRPDVETAGMGFVEGEVSNIRATGSITEVGEVKNDIAFDGGREFKEGNYEITYNYGLLKVTEKTVPPTDDKTTPTDNNTGTADKTAKTGDDFPIGLIAGAALLALAGAGAILFARRRKAN